MSTKGQACTECGRRLPDAAAEESAADFLRKPPEPFRRVGVVGMTRSGKSAWLKGRVAGWVRQGGDVVVWDPEDEWSALGVDRGEECKRGPLKHRLTVSELLRNREALLEHPLSLAVVPDRSNLRGKPLAEQLEAWIDLVRARGACTLLLEECWRYASFCEHLLTDIAAGWAKDGVPALFVAQACTMVPAMLRGQWSDLVTFQQVKTSDLRYLAGEAGADFAADVSELQPGQYRVANLRQRSPDALASPSP